MIKKLFHTILFCLFFISTAVALTAETLPVLIPNQSVVSVKTGITSYISLTLTVPSTGYVYANPKGPGIGKPLSINIRGLSVQPDSIKISAPEKDTSFGTDFVWVYKTNIIIVVPVITKNITDIRIEANGLFCSKNGRCTPFSSFATVKLIKGTPVNGNKPVLNGMLIPFGKEPPSDNKKTSLPVLSNNEGSGSITSKDLNNGMSINTTVFTPIQLSGSLSNIFSALFFGLIAGFILNFMPCVFPVLSIKLFGLISSDTNDSTRKTGIAYTSGIISSFILLASLAAFAKSGWGSLFQNTSFIIITIFILFVLSLSFLGVYSINIPGLAGKYASRTYKYGFIDSYIKGFLAAVLATPCSGPFLGATLAWTMTQPPFIIFAVFTSIGAGMSIPYILMAIKPSLLTLFPKPGNWMVILEKLLGFLLIGSVIYFIQILPEYRIINTLLMLLLSSITFWQYGEWGNITRAKLSRIISTSLMIILSVSALLIALRDNAPSNVEQLLQSKSFSENALTVNSSRAITMVIFTADWCPNCKIVEHAVLNDEEVIRLIKEREVTVMTADITRDGTEGESLLHRLGSSSIPFLAVFPKGKNFSSPICLRDIYSKSDVIQAIKKAEKLSE